MIEDEYAPGAADDAEMKACIEDCARIVREAIRKQESAPDCMPDNKTDYPELPPAVMEEITVLAMTIAAEVKGCIIGIVEATMKMACIEERERDACADAFDACMFILVREHAANFFSKKARRIAARAVSIYRDTLGASNNPGNHNQKKQ